MSKKLEKLAQIALEYYISIVREKYGEQVSDSLIVTEAQKLLQRELDDE